MIPALRLGLVLVLFAAPAWAQSNQPVRALAPQYFPIMTDLSSDETPPKLLPVISNQPLDRAHPEIRRVVFGIHDITRDANDLFAQLQTLAGPTASADTMIIAPQFLSDLDLQRYTAYLPDGGKSIVSWPAQGWAMGDNSEKKPLQYPISSFAALDLMMAYVSERAFFPNLEAVVLVGYGMGASYVQLYAFAGKGPELLDPTHVNVRYIVANSGHYLYLTNTRPKAGTVGMEASLIRPDPVQCPGYQLYPFGLERVNDYVKKQGVSAARLRFPSRAVHYMVSDQPPEDAAKVDQSCAAKLQGATRAERAERYVAYMQTTFGSGGAYRQQLHKLLTAPPSIVGLLGTTCGWNLLFGDGICERDGVIRGQVNYDLPEPVKQGMPPLPAAPDMPVPKTAQKAAPSAPKNLQQLQDAVIPATPEEMAAASKEAEALEEKRLRNKIMQQLESVDQRRLEAPQAKK